jgi:diacylglycerol kinase family enzyme
MKVAKLIHNPNAGDEEHSKKELISIIESQGYRCIYSSVKDENWKKIDPSVDFLIVAGGDGTVRKTVKKLLKRKVLERTWPIGLLPLGTANNIAKTLGVVGTTEEIIESWKSLKRKRFDVGCVSAGKDEEFFLEGFGCGIFPYLMLEIQNQKLESMENPEMKMNSTLGLLHQIVLAYEPRQLELTIDGAVHSGKYILVEIMNTRSIGPNLVLAPDADPGDGEFDLVLIAEKNKERFATYLENRLEGNVEEYRYDTLRGKDIRILWQGTHIHVDGKTMKIKQPVEMRVELRENVIEFLVP